MKQMSELAKEINDLAQSGSVLVFILKTKRLVGAASASVNGDALQITVTESPGSILGSSAKGHPKTMSAAAKKQRRAAGFKKGNKAASHCGN